MEKFDKRVPKKLGACADKLYKLRAARHEVQREVEKLRKIESALVDHLIKELPKDDAKGIVGKEAKAVIKTDEIPTAKNWDLVYKHVLKTGDFSLLQRRLSTAAIKERWEEGEKIPGVDVFTKISVSLTKK